MPLSLYALRFHALFLLPTCVLLPRSVRLPGGAQLQRTALANLSPPDISVVAPVRSARVRTHLLRASLRHSCAALSLLDYLPATYRRAPHALRHARLPLITAMLLRAIPVACRLRVFACASPLFLAAAASRHHGIHRCLPMPPGITRCVARCLRCTLLVLRACFPPMIHAPGLRCCALHAPRRTPYATARTYRLPLCDFCAAPPLNTFSRATATSAAPPARHGLLFSMNTTLLRVLCAAPHTRAAFTFAAHCLPPRAVAFFTAAFSHRVTFLACTAECFAHIQCRTAYRCARFCRLRITYLHTAATFLYSLRIPPLCRDAVCRSGGLPLPTLAL